MGVSLLVVVLTLLSVFVGMNPKMEDAHKTGCFVFVGVVVILMFVSKFLLG